MLRNGLPDSVNTYNSPTTFVMYSHDHAGYIQDRWTPTRKLTLNLGLRLESTYASEPALCQEQTLFIAAQCFSEIEGVPALVVPSPRFGAIYDVAGDGKTAIKLTINRYNQPIGVNYMQQVNPVRLTNDTRLWMDAQQRLRPAARRARSVDRIQPGHDEPVRRRPQVAVCGRVLGRRAAIAAL